MVSGSLCPVEPSDGLRLASCPVEQASTGRLAAQAPLETGEAEMPWRAPGAARPSGGAASAVPEDADATMLLQYLTERADDLRVVAAVFNRMGSAVALPDPPGGFPDAIVEAMNRHPYAEGVQSGGCYLLRLCVQSEAFEPMSKHVAVVPPLIDRYQVSGGPLNPRRAKPSTVAPQLLEWQSPPIRPSHACGPHRGHPLV